MSSEDGDRERRDGERERQGRERREKRRLRELSWYGFLSL